MKKIIAWIVLVLTAASCLPFAPAYGEENTGAEQKAAEKLVMLGMTRSYIPKSTISRGEFVSVLAKVITSDATVYGSDSYFLDVPPEHKYADEINKMAAYGAVTGDGNKQFHPDDNITLEQAAVMLVRFLGYHIHAENKGGYASGYTAQAVSLGLMKGVPVSSGAISRGNAYVMISNALEAGLFVQTGMGANAEYKADKTKTLLSEYMQVYHIKGVLWAVGNFSLLPDKSARENELIAGDKTIRTTAEQAWIWQDKVGAYVTAYYREDADIFSLVGIIESQSSSARESLVIDIDDITDISDTTIFYRENDKNKKISFQKSSYVMYNNRAAEVFDLDTLFDKSGMVTLSDPTGSGYNVIKIKVYDEYVVRGVALEQGIISDNYHICSPLPELTDEDSYYIHDEKGKKLEIGDIAPWNVLSVAVSQDESYREIVVSTQSAMGTVEAVDAEREITMSGRVYKLSKAYDKYTGKDLRPGQSVRVYFNAAGEIAASDTQNTDDFLPGVLVYAGFDTEEALPAAKIRVFAADSRFYTYDLKLNSSDKFRCNGNLLDLSELERLFRTPFDYDSAEEGELNSEITMAPIRYRLDDDGTVSAMEYDCPGNDENKVGMRKLNRGLSGNLTYKRTVRSFGGQVTIASDAVVFVCPADRNDEKDFSVQSITYFTNDTAYNLANMAIMATSRDSFEGAIVMRKRTLSAIGDSSNLGVVVKSYDTVNDDGENVQLIRLLEGGTEKDMTVKSGLHFACSRGDAVRFQVNGTGEIVLLDRWAHNNAGKLEWDKRTANFGYTQNSRIVYAVPEEIKGNVMKATIYDTASDKAVVTEYFLLSPFRHYLVDLSGGKIPQVSVADQNVIRDRKSFPENYSKLLIHTTKGDGKTIIIYNNWEER